MPGAIGRWRLVLSAYLLLGVLFVWAQAPTVGYDQLVVGAHRMLKDGNLPAVATLVEQAIALDGQRFEAWAIKAELAHRQGQLAAAKAALDQAMARAPGEKQAILRQAAASWAQATTPPAAARLSPDAQRKLDALKLIVADADRARQPVDRRRYLDEFLTASEVFLKDAPREGTIWLLRAAIAMEVERPDLAWAAGRQLLALGYSTSTDPQVRDVFASLEREGLMEEQPPLLLIPDLNLQLIWVAPGSFQMGSNDGQDDEKPVHEVRLTRGFWMGKTEVTQGQWQAVMGRSIEQQLALYQPQYHVLRAKMFSELTVQMEKSRKVLPSDLYKKANADALNMMSGFFPSTWPLKGKGEQYPVYHVSWDEAVGFCRILTEREKSAGRLPLGYEYRLPTEAEWEYSARGGKRSRQFSYSGGSSMDEVGWSYENSILMTHPVGQKQPNELGLLDMSGNVAEWCNDWYDAAYYKQGLVSDPAGPSTGALRVARGGAYNLTEAHSRPWRRFSSAPDERGGGGFRVALVPTVK